MPDIFVSYAREDRDRVEPLARALADRGFSVFWDREIPAGQTWRSHIGAALNDAGCVIVAWSSASVASEWVSEEADEAKQRGVLVPVLLDGVAPPIGFRSIQAADLSGWEPGRESPLFDQLLRDIGTVLGSERPRPEPREEAVAAAPRRGISLPIAGISIAVALVLALSFIVLRSGPSPDAPPAVLPDEPLAARVDTEAKSTPQPVERVTPETKPPAPVAAPPAPKYWLKLGELTCESASGFWKSGTDEPYIVVNGEREWGPHEVKCPAVKTVSAAPIELSADSVTIELRESDATEGYNAGDDSLGKVQISRRTGAGKEPFLEGGARYFLSWEIVQE